jgi:hypothetical protein
VSSGGARGTRTGAAARLVRAGLAVLLASLTAAGCAGDPKPPENVQSMPPPAKYKAQIATFLRTTLAQRADYQGTLIGAPALKPVGQSQHYVVCLKFNPRSELREKVVIYFGESIAQFVDAKPEQCADAAYQPFQDLEDMMPPK